MIFRILFTTSLVVLLACSQQSILTDFDSEKWQADTDGCNNQRGALAKDLINRKDKLTGLGQNEITELLGNADRHELYSRNKKAFVYFINGGPNCENQIGNQVSKLVIRFDGIGRAKEFVLYEN
jgi:hypothetical protein